MLYSLANVTGDMIVAREHWKLQNADTDQASTNGDARMRKAQGMRKLPNGDMIAPIGTYRHEASCSVARQICADAGVMPIGIREDAKGVIGDAWRLRACTVQAPCCLGEHCRADAIADAEYDAEAKRLGKGKRDVIRDARKQAKQEWRDADAKATKRLLGADVKRGVISVTLAQ